MNDEATILSNKVTGFIKGDCWAKGSDEEFEALALEIFDFQFRFIEPYRKLCQQAGYWPDRVQSWQDIPAVSCNAFKHFHMFAGRQEQIVKTFNSSGTSNASLHSKAHFSNAGLKLMYLSTEQNAERMLFADGCQSRILALAPPPDYAPSSIMAHGMAHIMKRLGLEDSRFLIGAGGIDIDEIIAVLEDSIAQNILVTLIGSSYGFVNLFDSLKTIERKFALTAGSRLMHAGGYKGRSREIDPQGFIELACLMLGIPAESVINLLGMTELASQIYDRILRTDHEIKNQSPDHPPVTRIKDPPPWMRTLLFDPRQSGHVKQQFITRPNHPGLLRHFDLANVERPMVIQTEDIGEWLLDDESVGRLGVIRGGFEVLGRAKTAEPRGCSITLEEFYRLRSS